MTVDYGRLRVAGARQLQRCLQNYRRARPAAHPFGGSKVKPTLEDLINSAKFCGLKRSAHLETEFGGIWVRVGETWQRWNPPQNPAQDQEIRDALVAKDYTVVYNDELGIHAVIDRNRNFIFTTIVSRGEYPVDDFLMLAASHVQEQSDD